MIAGAGVSRASEMTGALLVQWALAVYGLTLIITGSRIMEPLRRLGRKASDLLGYFLGCPMCMGFWISALLSLAGLPLFTRCDSGSLLVNVASAALAFSLNGAAGAALSWTAHVVLAKLGAEEL